MRPLSKQGVVEAEALADLLAPFAPTRIVSSPYVRCIQTVAPLAKSLGLHIERTKRLVPSAGGSAESYLRRVSRNKVGPVVLCTHREVIRHLQRELPKSNRELFGEDGRREKGSVWVLDRERGHIVRSEYLPPPRPFGSRRQ